MNMCPSNKCKTPPESCLKGQVFFIWTNYPSLESVKDKISLLGGKVEQFLSRDVTTVLVEDNQLVGPELLSPDLSVKSTYVANGTIVTSFPHPNNLTSLPSTSRGYNFLAASTSSKSVYSPYRIICYARQWGIQVLGIYQFLTWIEPQCKTVIRQKQRKATEHVNHLTGFFLKFEAVQKNHRPCYKMFNNDPERLLPLKNASILLKPETCNLILDKPISSRQIHFSHMDTVVKTAHQVKGANLPLKANDKRPQNNRLKPKDESNYCECCKSHFADLKQHIKSSKHQNFVSNDKNYETVHSILKMLPTPQDFIEKLENPSPNSDPLFVNGDAALCLPVTNVPETDYSMPLNLQVRKDNISSAVIPLNLHVENNNILSRNIQLIKQENVTLPLDLHVKRDNSKKTETKDAEVDKNMLINFEPVDLLSKKESSVVHPKLEVRNEPVLENVEVSEKQLVETNVEMQCEVMNGDPLFDRTNTAALAQLCLKNFDSYWLDTLPCEMDDIVFDDIFDFDDGKTKPENENGEPFGENFVNSDIAQTPGFVSGISTMNNSMDVKDIKIEPVNNQSFPTTCKLEKDNETVSDKKQIFSIASYCADKISMDATPSCSNTTAAKNAELLFSSESSDDDVNGNVLISNALNFITNSDSDFKGDKESSEENSIQDHSEVKSGQNQAVGEKLKSFDELCSVKGDILNQGKIDFECKKSPVLVHNSPVSEVKVNNASEGNNSIRTITADVPKNEFKNGGEISKGNKSFTNNFKNLSTNLKENCVVASNPVHRDLKSNYEISENVPGRNMNCNPINAEKPSNINSSINNEIASYKIKTDPESHKENASSNKRQELNSSSNKISQNYPVSASRTVEDTKVLKERILCKAAAEYPVSFEKKQFNDTSKGISEKYVIPKKNISLREMKVNQNTLDQNLKSPKSIAGEVKINQTNCDTTVKYLQHNKQETLHKKLIENPGKKVCLPNSKINLISPKVVPYTKKLLDTGISETYSRKRHHKKEKKIQKRIKEDDSFRRKCSISETNAKMDSEHLQACSVNPCQYSSRTDKFKVDKSNIPSAESPVSKQTKKIPHKKVPSKLQKLPPLWSVSAVPGSGVKLKFTCIHPKKIDVHQFETSDYSD